MSTMVTRHAAADTGRTVKLVGTDALADTGDSVGWLDRHLDADEHAGPHYTGQPAVDSYYATTLAT